MAEGFTCDVEPQWYRSACKELDFYGEHEGRRYCVLHFPGEEKKDVFEMVKTWKVARKDYNFAGAVFPKGTSDFSGFNFDTRTYFGGAKFLGDAKFSHAQFGGELNYFEEAQFRGETASFSHAQFYGEETRFYYARFRGETTDFTAAKFNAKGTLFENVEFGAKQTSFAFAHFSSRWTGFSDAQFRGEETVFTGTDFRGDETLFINTTFLKQVLFVQASFREKVLFRGTKGNLVFDSEAWVRFARARIDRPELLTFENVLLHPSWFISADVRKVDFTNVQWYGMPGGPEGTVRQEITKLQEHGVESPHPLLAHTCRRLSINAEEKREYQLADEFHYWSMEALRQAGWRCLGPIESLYWIASGCGERPRRAFGVLVGMWLLFAMLYMLAGFPQLTAFSLADVAQVGHALVYSLAAMTRLTETPAMVQLTELLLPSEPGLFQFLVTAEGILGPLQIALLLLAVRRKVMR